jgi:hypothetical protein
MEDFPILCLAEFGGSSSGAPMHRPSPARWLLAAGTALTLAACGGGGDSSSTGTGTPAAATTGGSQLASGAITGFGSVIVEGVRFDDSAAVIRIEDDAASPRSASVSALRLGMQVEVRADDSGRASAVTVSSEVYGRITALASDGFTVAGQTVKVSADPANPTVFEGVSGLSGLATNDFVEVHGKRDAANAIVASRIERKDPSSLAAIRVAGTVAALDATARTFTVGGLTVRYDATTRLLPAGAGLADGLRVAVWSDTAIVGNTLTAKSVVVKRHNLVANDLARVGGLVRSLDFAARRFKVDGVDVDASAAAFEKGTANDLATGRKVRVRGSFADGTLRASEVRFVKDQGDAKVELTGVVTDFAGAGSFKVRGVPIDASRAGIEFRNGSAANLANGVLVRIEADVSGNVVQPREVEFVTTADGQSRWLFGEVSGYDAGSGAFRLMGLDARLASSATLRNGDGTPATRADFGNADRVQVRGAFESGVFVVTEAVFRPGLQAVIDDVEGIAYEVDLAAGVFRLNGTVVRVGPATVFEVSRENLRNGVEVEVYGTVVGGQLVATRVEIKAAQGGDAARVKGMVTDFVSPASFRVAGQHVDAGAARFEPSGASAASIANGRFVEVEGPVVAGVLKAVKVELE